MSIMCESYLYLYVYLPLWPWPSQSVSEPGTRSIRKASNVLISFSPGAQPKRNPRTKTKTKLGAKDGELGTEENREQSPTSA